MRINNKIRQFTNLIFNIGPTRSTRIRFEHIRNGQKLFATVPEVSESNSSTKRKRNAYLVPSLSPERISEISSVTGIAIGFCYFSWFNVSLSPTLTVLDWNAKLLPDDFRTTTNEPELLKLAYSLKNSLPKSDLYIMETFSMRGKELSERINEIHLSSMLTVLLNGADMVPGWMDKVFFQKKVVLNRLYGLLVGSERVSGRLITEDIINKSSMIQPAENNSKDVPNTCIEFLQINSKYVDVYKEAFLEKQEDLSTVFLLTLSFLDVNVFKNIKSLTKARA